MLSSLSSPAGQPTIQHLLVSDGDEGKVLFDQKREVSAEDIEMIGRAIHQVWVDETHGHGVIQYPAFSKYGELLLAAHLLDPPYQITNPEIIQLRADATHFEHLETTQPNYWQHALSATCLKLVAPTELDAENMCPSLLAHVEATMAQESQFWDFYSKLNKAFMVKVLKPEADVVSQFQNMPRGTINRTVYEVCTSAHWNYYNSSPVTIAAYLKLLIPEVAQHIERDPYFWEHALGGLQQCREADDWHRFAWEAAMLTIVGSEQAELTENGIELHGHLRQPPDSTPPLPLLRHQVSKVLHA